MIDTNLIDSEGEPMGEQEQSQRAGQLFADLLAELRKRGFSSDAVATGMLGIAVRESILLGGEEEVAVLLKNIASAISNGQYANDYYGHA